jgi:hypothetical protein
VLSRRAGVPAGGRGDGAVLTVRQPSTANSTSIPLAGSAGGREGEPEQGEPEQGVREDAGERERGLQAARAVGPGAVLTGVGDVEPAGDAGARRLQTGVADGERDEDEAGGEDRLEDEGVPGGDAKQFRRPDRERERGDTANDERVSPNDERVSLAVRHDPTPCSFIYTIR